MTHTAPILVAEIDEAMLDSDYAQPEVTPPQQTPERLDTSSPGWRSLAQGWIRGGGLRGLKPKY